MARNTPRNSDSVIDSRDIIERIAELESELEDLVSYVFEAQETLDALNADDPLDTVETVETALKALSAAQEALETWDGQDELKALKALAEEAEGYAPDWYHGATLIHENHFTEYCQEMLEDCGDLPKGLPSYIVIDWEATADNLKQDYTEVDFYGETYLVR